MLATPEQHWLLCVFVTACVRACACVRMHACVRMCMCGLRTHGGEKVQMCVLEGTSFERVVIFLAMFDVECYRYYFPLGVKYRPGNRLT